MVNSDATTLWEFWKTWCHCPDFIESPIGGNSGLQAGEESVPRVVW